MPAKASPIQPAPDELPQGGNAARVIGRSGVIWIACLSLYFPLPNCFNSITLALYCLTHNALGRFFFHFSFLLLLIAGPAVHAREIKLPNEPFDQKISQDSALHYVGFSGNLEALSSYQIDWLIHTLKFAAGRPGMMHDSSLVLIERAEDIAKQTGKMRHLASICIQKGNLYVQKGDLNQAFRCFYLGIEFFEKIGSVERISGYPYIEIGNVFYKLQQYKKARVFYNKAYRHFLKYSEKTPLWGNAVSLNNIALTYREQQKHDSALYYFHRAYMVREQIGDSLALLHSTLYLIQENLVLGNFEQAASLLNEARHYPYFVDKDARTDYEKEIHLEEAKLHLAQGRYQEALKRLREAKEAKAFPYHLSFNINVYDAFHRVFVEKGQIQKADVYIDSALFLAKELNNAHLEMTLLEKKAALVSLLNDASRLKKLTKRIFDLHHYLDRKQTETLGELFDSNLELAATKVRNESLTHESIESKEEAQQSLFWLFITLLVLTVFVIIGIVAIRQSKRAQISEANERSAHNRIRTLINSIENTILSLEANGNILLINTAAINFYKNVVDIEIHEGDNFLKKLEKEQHISLWEKILKRAETDKTPWTEAFYVNSVNPMHIQRSLTPVLDEQGGLAGIIVVGTNTTKAKKQEEEILAQKEKLDKANKAKQQMLGLLAHDLKDVIYSAHGLSEMVLDTPEAYEKENLLEFFELLFANFSKNKILLENVLDWAKTQTGGLHIVIKQVILEKLVHTLFDTLESKAGQKGIKLEREIEKDLALETDEDMLMAILRNLCSNAIKFSPSGVGAVKVKAHSIENDMCRISVIDNGIGMKPGKIEQVLKQPGAGSTSGTAGEQGAGFGLSICEEYLNMLHSTLEVRSEPNRGSTFYFDLPLKRK